MNDDVLIILLCVYLPLALAVFGLLWWAHRNDPPAPRQQPMPYKPIATVAAIALIALTSWAAQRDDEQRAQREVQIGTALGKAIAAVKCPKPDAPLEKLVITIGAQHDSALNAPTITCTYVTAPLGAIPQFRRVKPVYANAN